jgi:transposase
LFTLYCGLDLSSKDSQVAWADNQAKIVREQRIPLTRDRLQSILAPHRGRVLVGCEATTNAFWVHDILSAVGVEMRVAPPYQLKIISQTCYKTDRIDARKMAMLLAKDMFPSVWVPPIQLRDLRELSRLRAQLVKTRSQWIGRHHSLLHRWGLSTTRKGVEILKDRALPRETGVGTRTTDREILHLVTHLDARIRWTERETKRRIREVPPIRNLIRLLMTIPGVGICTATVLALEVGRIDRFRGFKAFARFCRLTPGVRQSGDMHRNLGLAKDARRDLGWLLTEDAWTARRVDPYFAAQYDRRTRSGIKPCRAIVPVARSLAHAIYLVWRRQTTYQKLFKEKSSRPVG